MSAVHDALAPQLMPKRAHVLNQWLSLNEATIAAARDTATVTELVDGSECVSFTLGGLSMQSGEDDPFVLAAALHDLADHIAVLTVEHREAQIAGEREVA